MSTARSVTYEFRAKFDSFKAQLAAGSRSVDDFGKKLTALDAQGARMRQGLSHFGNIAGVIGLGAAAGLGAAVAASAKFEKALSGVSAATGESAEGMASLREAALQAGADTAYSATEAANAIEELAKAGLSTQDILGGGLAGALNLAAAGGLEVADAAEIAASALNQFNLEGQDVGHVADLLASAAGNASGEVSDYAAALQQSGLVAAQFGLTIEETTGTLAAMGSTGFVGSDSGTSLKAFFQALIPNSEKAATAMEDMGFSAFDAQGRFVGMAEVAGQLERGLSGMTEQQQAATLKTIFGSDAVRAASLIYEQGADGIQEWITKTNDAGAASEMAAEKMDNLLGDLETLGGAFETALIGTGDGGQGALRGTVQALTSLINVYNDMPGPAKTATGAVLGLTAAAGGGLFAYSKATIAIAETKQAIQDLGIESKFTRGALSRLALSAGGFAIVSVAALKLKQEYDEFGDAVEAANEALASGDVSKMGAALKELETQLESTRESLQTSGIGDFLAEQFDPRAAADRWRQGFSFLSGGDSPIQQAEEQIRRLKSATEAQELADVGLSNATRQLARDAGLSTDEIVRMGKALKASRKDATETARSFINLGDSLDDGKVSLSDWLGELEANRRALRNFRENAIQAAEQGLDHGLIRALQKAGEEGARRMEQLANATDTQISRANKAWRGGQREVKRYTDEIGGVPETAVTKVKLDGIQSARDAIAQLRRDLSNPIVQPVVVQYKGRKYTETPQDSNPNPIPGADQYGEERRFSGALSGVPPLPFGGAMVEDRRTRDIFERAQRVEVVTSGQSYAPNVTVQGGNNSGVEQRLEKIERLLAGGFSGTIAATDRQTKVWSGAAGSAGRAIARGGGW